MRYTLIYDLGYWDDESTVEEFETVEELLERYYEIEYEVCELEAWDGDKKFAPWFE